VVSADDPTCICSGRRRAPSRVFVVERDPAVRQLVTVALAHADFVVTSSPGLSPLFEGAGMGEFDVAVLDRHVWGTLGQRVREALRGGSASGDVRMLVFSGVGSAEAVLSSLRAGADAFLEKPARIDELVGLVTELSDDLSREADPGGDGAVALPPARVSEEPRHDRQSVREMSPLLQLIHSVARSSLGWASHSPA
jgi:DNA-binding response OmpR family regulator